MSAARGLRLMGVNAAAAGKSRRFPYGLPQAAVPDVRVATASEGSSNTPNLRWVRGTSAPDEPLSAPGAGSAVARGAALRVGAYALGQALALGAAALLFRHPRVGDARPSAT